MLTSLLRLALSAVLVLTGCATLGGSQGTPEFKRWVGHEPETVQEKADDEACAQKGSVAFWWQSQNLISAYRDCLQARGYKVAPTPLW